MSAAVPHPSRSAPLCRDCRHFVPTARPRQVCDHPLTPVSEIDGQPYWPAALMRDEDGRPGRCGPSGEWFEAALPVSVSGQNGLEVRDVPVQAVEQRHGVTVERQGVEVRGHQLGAALRGPWAERLFDAPSGDGKPCVGLQDGLVAGQVGDDGRVHSAPSATAGPHDEVSAGGLALDVRSLVFLGPEQQCTAEQIADLRARGYVVLLDTKEG